MQLTWFLADIACSRRCTLAKSSQRCPSAAHRIARSRRKKKKPDCRLMYMRLRTTVLAAWSKKRWNSVSSSLFNPGSRRVFAACSV